MAHKKLDFELPLSVITVADLARLERELVGLDEFSLQTSIREAGKMPKMPRTTHSLEELARQNGCNLLIESDRKELAKQLANLKTQAPVMHLSFATDPKPDFLNKLAAWFRDEIHPYSLLQIGLQPSLAAGCMLRTTNKYFDFSLRQHLDERRQLLIDKLKEPA